MEPVLVETRGDAGALWAINFAAGAVFFFVAALFLYVVVPMLLVAGVKWAWEKATGPRASSIRDRHGRRTDLGMWVS